MAHSPKVAQICGSSPGELLRTHQGLDPPGPHRRSSAVFFPFLEMPFSITILPLDLSWNPPPQTECGNEHGGEDVTVAGHLEHVLFFSAAKSSYTWKSTNSRPGFTKYSSHALSLY